MDLFILFLRYALHSVPTWLIAITMLVFYSGLKFIHFFSCSPLVKHYRVIRKHDGGFIIDVEPKVSINTKAQFWVQLYILFSMQVLPFFLLLYEIFCVWLTPTWQWQTVQHTHTAALDRTFFFMVLLAIEIKCYDLLENNKVFNSKGCGGNKIVMAADDCFNLAAVFTTQPGVCGFLH